MKREIIRVEPLATYLEKYKAPASTVTKHGDTIYVSGCPPFDPKTGEIFKGPRASDGDRIRSTQALCRNGRFFFGKHSEAECLRHLSRHVPCGEYRLQALFPGKSARAHLYQCPCLERGV